jgi:hypothetical protein
MPIWDHVCDPWLPLLVGTESLDARLSLRREKMNCCGINFGQWREDTPRQLQDWRRESQTSNNQAFDEYRTATLRRLEEEQHEFREFLSRLQMAKDKAEFDGFMASRRAQSESPQPQT